MSSFCHHTRLVSGHYAVQMCVGCVVWRSRLRVVVFTLMVCLMLYSACHAGSNEESLLRFSMCFPSTAGFLMSAMTCMMMLSVARIFFHSSLIFNVSWFIQLLHVSVMYMRCSVLSPSGGIVDDGVA